MNNSSVEGELRYIVSWFSEWSELQRDDFVPIIVEYLTRDSECSLSNGLGKTNSVMNADIGERPMSLFQCRIKLFREWTPNWPDLFKDKLKEKIIKMDTKVGEKISKEIKDRNVNTKHSKGNFENIKERSPETNEQEICSDKLLNDANHDETLVEEESVKPVVDVATVTSYVRNEAVAEPADQVQMQALEPIDIVATTTAVTTTAAETHSNSSDVPLLI